VTFVDATVSASRIPTPTGDAEYGNEFEVKGSGEGFCRFPFAVW
jgi:hypothetical protein